MLIWFKKSAGLINQAPTLKMPELPEVETIVRNLSSKLKGLEISSVKIIYPPVLRKKKPSLINDLKGRKVVSVRRRGKMLLINFERNLSLLIHLKMTGQLLFYPREEPLDKHTHFILSFKDENKELRFRDVRKFGFISCIRNLDISCADELKNLGPEPLEIDFPLFKKLFQGRKARLKSLLLNQNFIAGIGNIYADEILFQAKLHPLTPASHLGDDDLKRLLKAIRDVLRKAIVHKGSSIRSFTNAEGKRGKFQNYHQVYGRESQSCFICGEKIKRLRLGGRSSSFCPRCQKEKNCVPGN
ncbi:MAG TPA: bifunctional DNA-formamidopyrimidine glycosylase/DNA-(apurinic or apyrimidinic site) lyase [Candidatus Aminicenantes bacterium]|nr:bifunctional DNA-formamidopyrimidine glycosylase/DNA-(apurinic or apyrimidinic site) lyase [Candidatus Aminicenantes bacterium]